MLFQRKLEVIVEKPITLSNLFSTALPVVDDKTGVNSSIF